MRQGSIHLPDTDFFWIIPCSREYSVILKKQSLAMLKVTQNRKYWIFISSQYVINTCSYTIILIKTGVGYIIFHNNDFAIQSFLALKLIISAWVRVSGSQQQTTKNAQVWDYSCSNQSNLKMKAESLTKTLPYLNLNISRTKNGRNKL